MAATLPFIEKYRPKDLSEIYSHQDLIANVTRMIDSGRLPHLLFYGPAGTGKTSTALVIARMMYGKTYRQNVLELNASDDRGIDVVREQVKGFISAQSFAIGGKKMPKLVILDEADNMTKPAQFALRRMMEEFAHNSRFILCCNYLHKIIMPLQSRCNHNRLAVLPESAVIDCIQKVAKAENITLTLDATKAIVRIGNGDMRKVLNILQQASMSSKETIEDEDIYHITGTPQNSHIKQMLHAMFNLEVSEAYKAMNEIFDKAGYTLIGALQWLYEEVRLIKMPLKARRKVIPTMAEIQARLEMGANSQLQLLGLCGAFALARSEMELLAAAA
eukprot:GEMP01042768.1.p1 GENE.GEMP01042768.1~~GEMP01042768.1.p1  ORF type:complete len:360 (+),score=43.57 GEMP01042768.1:86-1081(+)